MRILLVDDQKDIIKDIGGFLEERGYQVALAFDGKAAMQSLEEGRYDLVVTDIRMPDVDGMTLLRWMKEKSPGTEVILITGYGSLDSAIEALRLGAYDYIRKPFDLAELFQAISNCLEKKGRHRRRRQSPRRTGNSAWLWLSARLQIVRTVIPKSGVPHTHRIPPRFAPISDTLSVLSG